MRRLAKIGGEWVELLAEPSVPSEPVGNVQYLDLPGTNGNYASTPDSVGASITSDFDMRMKLSMDNWATVQGFAAQYGGAGDRGWRFYAAGGQIQIDGSADGTAITGALSSAATGFSAGSVNWIRVTWRNSDNRCQFFTSAGSGDPSWVQLGTDQTLNLTGIFDSTAAIVLGAAASAGNSLMLAGNIYYFELRNGIDGPVVAKFNANAVTRTATRTPTTLVSSTGETWTVNGSAWDWVIV